MSTVFCDVCFSDVKRGQNLEAEAEAKNNYEKSTK